MTMSSLPEQQTQEQQTQQTQQPQAQTQEARSQPDRPYWHRSPGDGPRSVGDSGSLAGDHVLRGTDADALTAVDFNVNLRTRPSNPDDRLAEAHAVGFSAGWAQGRLEAAEAEQAMALRAAAEAARIQAEQVVRFEQALGALVSAARRIEQQSLPSLVAAEQQLVSAALQLAEGLVGAELRHLPDPGRTALRRVLSELPMDETVVVRLNPADHAALVCEGTSEFLFDGRPVSLIADPDMAVGDAIGESGPVTVDARLGTALERVKEVLGEC